MTILIRQAVIVYPGHAFHQQKKDILIQNGNILRVAEEIGEQADRIIEEQGLHVSPGWVDVFAHFCDPGFEFKETLETGARAAAAGGYTHVFVLPNTQPAIHSKSQVEYIKEKSRSLPVSVHPIGAVSKNTEGRELAEMYDMYSYGAIAFGDGKNPIQSAGVLLKALQYVKAFNGVVIQMPEDRSIGTHGLMNEGIVSTRLGLPGKPVISEEMMVARDIELAAYAGSRLHFTGISSARSVELIEAARQKGIHVTCSVAPYQLYFSDEDLQGYDTNLKVNPPLRTPQNREALKAAVKQGVVDIIASHHFPQEWDSKVCEFEYAGNGMTGLETAFGVASAAGVTPEQWVSMVGINPRKVFNLPEISLQEGSVADLTLFNPEREYVWEERMVQSKSKNSPFIGTTIKGRPVGIINKTTLWLNTQD